MRNPILKRLLSTGLFLVVISAAYASDPTQPALREELLRMAARDQEVRRASAGGNFSKWSEVDAANQARLKQVVEQYGWPTFAAVGHDGASAAWLIAQHADTDKSFQLKVLALMEPLVQVQQASGKDYAYLYDRTHYPQRFGTQGACVSRDEWQPFAIEGIANLDVRRRELKLSSLAEYAKLFKEACANPYTALHRATDPRRTVPVPLSSTVETP